MNSAAVVTKSGKNLTKITQVRQQISDSISAPIFADVATLKPIKMGA